MTKNNLFTTIFFVQALLLVLLPTISLALSSGGMGIAPNETEQFPDRSSWFIYEVDPGDVIKDEVIVLNSGDEPIHLTLESLDAILTSDGSFSLKNEPKDNTDIGTWITFDKTEFDLAPNTQQITPFTITIPENAEVGDHLGGLAIYQSESDKTIKSGGTNVSISTRVGARIYLTVAGDIVRDWNIRKKSFYGLADKMAFNFKIENKGNIRANLNISEGKIYNIFGLYDEQTDVSIGQAFPQENFSKTIYWPGKDRPFFGPYLAILTIEDEYQSMNPDSTLFIPPVEPITIWMITFFVPYTQIAVLIGLIFIIWFFYQLFHWFRLSRLARRPVVAYKIKKGDSLMAIAHSYNVSWKLVAKLNEIKPPYSLDEKKELYIPDASGDRMDINVPHFFGFISRPLQKLFSKRMPQYEIIVVEKGDKIKDIEDFADMKWAEIAKLNKLKPNSKPKTNQELKIIKKK